MGRLTSIIAVWIVSFCLLNTTSLSASHIIGGDIYYTQAGYNNDSSLVSYDIEFLLYRDTAGLDFDVLAEFGVFRKLEGGEWESYQVVKDVPISSIVPISALQDPCKDELLSELIIETGTYHFRITLETGPYTYMVAHQRCCRNYTISNILDPGQTGAVYDIIITPEAMNRSNNSPVFESYPPIFVCLGFDFDFDHRAIDQEGDSLVYSFCTPFISGTNPPNPPAICCDCVKPDPRTCLPNFDEVIYTGFYNEANPVGGNPQIRIHPRTGHISGVPDILGSFVVGVCVEEYRDGTFIGSYRRDFEFNVDICTPRVYADLISEGISYDEEGYEDLPVHLFQTCANNLDLINASIDEDFIEDYKWLIYNPEGALVQEAQGLEVRDLEATFDGTGRYQGYMILNDQLKCVDTAILQIEVVNKADLDFDLSYDLCQAGPITFVNTSSPGDFDIESWSWDIDGTERSTDKDASITGTTSRVYDITLTAIDEFGCHSELQRSINYDIWESELTIEILDTIICEGDTINFGGELYWEEGSHSQLLLSRDGCDSLDRTWMVDVREAVSIELISEDSIRVFLESPIEIYVNNPVDQIRWYPSLGLSCDDCLDPVVYLEEDQSYRAEVVDDIGCIGELEFDLFVDPGIDFYVPNVLMPKAPGHPVNEFFFLHVDPEYSFLYNLLIYDRWGNKIYHRERISTNVVDDGWSPDPYMAGVYVYYIEILADVHEPVLAGDITVIR